MIGMSFSETIFLFVLALVIFGPKKLPEIARQVGKYLNEFRRASNEFKAQIEQEIAHLETETKQTVPPPSPPVQGTASRDLNPPLAEVTPSEPSAMAVAATEELAPSNHSSTEGGSPSVETSAVPTPDAVTSPASQESHA